MGAGCRHRVGKQVDSTDFVENLDRSEVLFARRIERAFNAAASSLLEQWDDMDPQTAEAAYRALMSIRWDESFELFAEEWERGTRKVMTEAGEKSFANMRAQIRGGDALLGSASFSVENPYSRVYIRDKSSRLIKEISESTRSSVVEMLDLALREGRAPARLRNAIADTVGLHSRWARAVDRYRAELEADGIAPGRVDRLTERYRKRLLRRRGENIARTETISAGNQGKLDSWKVAQDRGWLGSRARMVWIAGFSSARTCVQCAAMHNQTIAIGGTFEFEEHEDKRGRRVPAATTLRPPLHPSCRCTMGLVVDDD
jgi:hypothetical protein